MAGERRVDPAFQLDEETVSGVDQRGSVKSAAQVEAELRAQNAETQDQQDTGENTKSPAVIGSELGFDPNENQEARDTRAQAEQAGQAAQAADARAVIDAQPGGTQEFSGQSVEHGTVYTSELRQAPQPVKTSQAAAPEGRVVQPHIQGGASIHGRADLIAPAAPAKQPDARDVITMDSMDWAKPGAEASKTSDALERAALVNAASQADQGPMRVVAPEAADLQPRQVPAPSLDALQPARAEAPNTTRLGEDVRTEQGSFLSSESAQWFASMQANSAASEQAQGNTGSQHTAAEVAEPAKQRGWVRRLLRRVTGRG